MDKTVWLWTRYGGQLGLHPDNILCIMGTAVWDRKGTRYSLDKNKWDENITSYMRGIK